MYLLSQIRGKGLGRAILQKLLTSASADGYRSMYLETFEPMIAARGLYESAGFKLLSSRLGNTGHFSCNIWYLKKF